MISYYDLNNPLGLLLTVQPESSGCVTVRYAGETLIARYGEDAAGCSCLVANGCYPLFQQPGVALEHHAGKHIDMLSLELKRDYPPESGVDSIRRLASLKRVEPQGQIDLLDGVSFLTPGMLESALVTPARVEIGVNAVILHGERAALRVEYDVKQIAVRADSLEGVSRLVFAFAQPRKSGVIRLGIKPV